MKDKPQPKSESTLEKALNVWLAYLAQKNQPEAERTLRVINRKALKVPWKK